MNNTEGRRRTGGIRSEEGGGGVNNTEERRRTGGIRRSEEGGGERV